MFPCDLPRVALGSSLLADPMEAVGSNLCETPSSFQTARVTTELDNVITLGPPDLAGVILVERVVPNDVPATDPRIEDAQGRAIHGGRCRALGPDPNVLNRTAFQHPSKMAFSIPFLNCALVEVADRVHFPASNEPSIQLHVFRSVGWGTFGSVANTGVAAGFHADLDAWFDVLLNLFKPATTLQPLAPSRMLSTSRSG